MARDLNSIDRPVGPDPELPEVHPPDLSGDADASDPQPEPGSAALLTSLNARMRSTAESAISWLEAQRPRRPAVDFAFLFMNRDGDAAGGMLGSAVAFRFFLFMVPVMLLVAGVLGFLSANTSVHDAAQASGISGALRSQVDQALTQSHSTRWVAFVLGAWGSLWAGRSLAKVLGAVSGFAWQVPIRKSTTFKTLLGIVGVIFGAFATAAVIVRLRADRGVAVATLGFGAVGVVYFIGWYVVSLMLPRATRDPAAVLPGAAVLATAMSLLQWFSQIWLPDRFARASQLYGAIGTTAVTLAFFFIIGRLFVWSMVLNAVTWERFGTISTITFSLPGVRAIPRRSARVRRFFGLDDDETDPER